jgi:hypothetical protein
VRVEPEQVLEQDGIAAGVINYWSA